MAKLEIIIPFDILTATTDMLRKLQGVYPANQTINQVLDIFEILSFYGKNIKSEDRISVSESCINILQELASITKTLEPYLEPDKQVFSDDEREKLESHLNINADSILDIVKEHKKGNRRITLHLLNELCHPSTNKLLSIDGVELTGTRTQLGLIVNCLESITNTSDLEVTNDDTDLLMKCKRALEKAIEQSESDILDDPDNPRQ